MRSAAGDDPFLCIPYGGLVRMHRPVGRQAVAAGRVVLVRGMPTMYIRGGMGKHVRASAARVHRKDYARCDWLYTLPHVPSSALTLPGVLQ